MASRSRKTDRPDASPHAEELMALCGEALGRLYADGRLEPLNAAWEAALRRPRAELSGLPLLSFIHPEDRVDLRAAWEAASDGRPAPARIEARAKRGDGTWARLSWTLTSSERRDAVLVAARDVSETSALRESLLARETAAQIGRLAMGLVHDVNNLLSLISGYAAHLRETLGPRGPHVEDLDALDESVNAGKELACAVADTTLGERGTEACCLNGTVTRVQRLLSRPMSGVRLRLELDPDAGRVALPAADLIRILLNLCLNARDAMPRGGIVIVSTSRERGERKLAVLSVSDSGRGMPDHVQRKAFEPGFTTKKDARCAGFGLAVVKEIAESCGGAAGIVSRPGQGTSVHVRLPVFT